MNHGGKLGIACLAGSVVIVLGGVGGAIASPVERNQQGTHSSAASEMRAELSSAEDQDAVQAAADLGISEEEAFVRFAGQNDFNRGLKILQESMPMRFAGALVGPDGTESIYVKGPQLPEDADLLARAFAKRRQMSSTA